MPKLLGFINFHIFVIFVTSYTFDECKDMDII